MGCPRRNVQDFGRVFLMLNYTDITQKTHVQRRTVTEIIAREKCGRHKCQHTVGRPWRHTCPTRLPDQHDMLIQWPWHVCYSQLVGDFWSANMPFVFSHVGYCDMHFVYELCDDNACATVQEYQRRLPDRRTPSRSVFMRIHRTLRDTGSLPSVSCSLKGRWYERLSHERTFFWLFREVHVCPPVEWPLASATKVARSYASWLLHLGPHEDISVWN